MIGKEIFAITITFVAINAIPQGIVIIGGSTRNDVILTARPVFQLVNPITNQFTALNGSAQLGGRPGASQINNTIYITYAENAYSYNPSTQVLKGEKAPKDERKHHTSVALLNKIYICGGNNIYPLYKCEVYDANLKEWTPTPSMREARASHAAAVVNGKMYQIGGFNNPLVYNSMESFDPATNLWTDKPSMNQNRHSHSACSRGNTIYVCGGDSGVNQILKSCESFTIGENQWKWTASLKQPRYGLGLINLQNKFYAIGGSNSTNCNTLCGSNSIEEVDFVANVSKLMSQTIEGPRFSFGYAVVGY